MLGKITAIEENTVVVKLSVDLAKTDNLISHHVMMQDEKRNLVGEIVDIKEKEAYINTYLNNTYLNSLLAKLDTSLQNKITIHTYNVGPVKNVSGQDLATDISQEQAYKWKGKVGLMTATDYVKASTNSACTSVREYYNTSGCYSNSTTHNYLAKSYTQWTMSPTSNYYSYFVWNLNSAGRLIGGSNAFYSLGVRPVLYLSSNVKLQGDGTAGSKFEIK